MAEINISQIKSLAIEGKIMWTEHVVTRIRERGILRADVIECIDSGEIIKQYPDDIPFPSCLTLGKCGAGEPLHIVVELNTDTLCCIITAYRPDLEKW